MKDNQAFKPAQSIHPLKNQLCLNRDAFGGYAFLTFSNRGQKD
jgi:hypothetical protein